MRVVREGQKGMPFCLGGETPAGQGLHFITQGQFEAPSQPFRPRRAFPLPPQQPKVAARPRQLRASERQVPAHF